MRAMHRGWELKIDGATCPSGKMAQDLYVQPHMNPHRGMPEIYGVRSMTPANFGVNLPIEACIYMHACLRVCMYVWYVRYVRYVWYVWYGMYGMVWCGVVWYVCLYVCMHACMDVCMHACMHVCTVM